MVLIQGVCAAGGFPTIRLPNSRNRFSRLYTVVILNNEQSKSCGLVFGVTTVLQSGIT